MIIETAEMLNKCKGNGLIKWFIGLLILSRNCHLRFETRILFPDFGSLHLSIKSFKKMLL